MQITQEIIQQYLNGHCSKEEEQLVKEWLAMHPEQLSMLMTERSWNEFKGNSTSVEASPRMFQYIKQKTKPSRSMFYRWVAAASVMIVLFGAIYFKMQSHEATALPRISVIGDRVTTTTIDNKSDNVQTTVLSDGSVIQLSPGSSIKYDSIFVHRRDIFLAGEAKFTVAKDSTKPFCVHSGVINATALGTIFSVSDRDTKNISVELFEGKVVVRNETIAVAKLKDIFLHPGESLTVNKMNMSFEVMDRQTKLNVANVQKLSITKPIAMAALQFNNQPLKDIFKDLQNTYNVEIIFKDNSSQDLRFTGRHNPTIETLDEFINTIAMLNDLKVEKRKSLFVITSN